MTRYKIHLTVLAVIATSFAAGCGQKGPLYLPAKTEEAAQQSQAKTCQTQRCQDSTAKQAQPKSQ